MDVLLATFSAVQLVLALGAALIAFSLRKTFEGGIFEKAWRVIAIAPVVYGLGQAVALVGAMIGETQTIGFLASTGEVIFLVLLVSGLFLFASAWRGIMRQDPDSNPRGGMEEGDAKTTKGAMVFILGKNAASATVYYTGEPNIEGFESRLRGLLGNGAATAIKHMVERGASRSNKKEKENAQ